MKRTRLVSGRLGLALALTTMAGAGCPTEADPDDDQPRVWALAHEESGGALLSVFGPSADDAWAVGGQLTDLSDPGTGLALHRDGTGWTAMPLPPSTPLLNWIHADGESGEGELWTVGNAGAALRRVGDDWQAVPTPVDVPLWGVFVLATNDVWAVGGDVFDAATPGVVLHFDGNAWTDLQLPMLDRGSAAFFKVWAASTSDVFIVGDNGVILHFDGTTLSQQPSSTTSDLISVWGTGPDEVVAVGGRSIGTLVRYDGSVWTSEDYGEIAGLNGVWVSPQGDATIVGNLGAAADVPALGVEATTVPSGAGFNVLHAVFGFESGGHYAVGGTIDRSPPWSGIIIER